MVKYFSFGLLLSAVLASVGCKLPAAGAISPFKRPLTATPTSPLFRDGELTSEKAAEACIVTAKKLEAAGHRREAIGLYERARRHDAKAIDYSRRLAVLYDQTGDVASAAREYSQAIEAEPDNADLINDFGQFHLTQGDLARAETNFRKAISLDAEHQRAWTNLGITLARQTRYREAFDAFVRIVGPAAAHSNIGSVMAKQGRIQEAQQAFRQAIALNPELKQPQAFLAYYAQQSRHTATPASFTEANVP